MTEVRRQRRTFIAALLVASGLCAGWYRTYSSVNAARREAETKLAHTETALAETKANLKECNSWMDTRLAVAEAAALGAQDAQKGVPSLPVVPSSERVTTDSTPTSVLDDDESRLLRRRRRMLAIRGQLNALEGAPDGGAPR
jgi:hypothetical protein